MGRFGLRCLRDNLDDDSDRDGQINVEVEEEELPHPIPFDTILSPSWGSTRFGLHPFRDSYEESPDHLHCRVVAPVNSETAVMRARPQRFPPMLRYFDPSTASAVALMQHRNDYSVPSGVRNDNDMDSIRQLLAAASLDNDTPARHIQVQKEVALKMMRLAESTRKESQKLEEWNLAYGKKIDQQHKASFISLKSILKADHETAKAFMQLEKQELKIAEDRAKLEEDSARREQATLEESRRKDDEAKNAILREKEEKKEMQLQAKKKLEQKVFEKMAYVSDAHSSINKLVEIRASVHLFEKDSAVSKRRMNLKKMCRGRVNTLAADVGKVQSVALELIAVMKDEKEIDNKMNEQLQQGNSEISITMTKGYLYAMDLLASSAAVRIQAEGFNGPRGDGFPLAAFLAIVSSEVEGFSPIMEAHIFSVCPTAIPTLPKLGSDATEDELKECLGMVKNKSGEFESFQRFLHRTEGIISIVANIMSSHPSNHILFGGHRSAVTWLQRFLDLMPPKPEQLPLNAAPVLDAFLTGAGHMLANLFATEFTSILDVIKTDMITRLDEGSVGAPSALRLKQTMKGGFDSFRKNLPSRALDALYNDGGSMRLPLPNPPTNSTSGLMSAPSNPFGASTNPTPFAPSSFGQSYGANANPSTASFIGGRTLETELPRGPFAPISFGQSSGVVANPSTASFAGDHSLVSNDSVTMELPSGAFGGASLLEGQSSGSFSSNPTTLPMTTTTAFPFGTPPPPSNTTFGAAPTSVTPFGAPQSMQASFGFGFQGGSQFGSVHTVQTPSSSVQPNPLNFPGPFGSQATIPANSPFGVPFGGSSVAPHLPQYGSNASNQSYAGAFPSTNGKNKAPCKFFPQGTCRNGDQCRFSHDVQSAVANNTNRFGNSPFGDQRR